MEKDKKETMDPAVSKYLREVEQRLRMPPETRQRVLGDIRTGIEMRQAHGVAVPEILESMGDPAELADNMNTGMKDYTSGQSSLRYVFLILAAAGAIFLILPVLTVLAMKGNPAMIGGADAATQIFVVSSPALDLLLNYLLPIAALAAGLYGYYRLNHLKPKKTYGKPDKKN